MISLRRAAIEIVTVAAVGGLFSTLFSGNSYLLAAAGLAMIYAMLGVSLNIIWGLAGQFSMAQGGLMAVAAYASSIAVMQWQWPFWWAAAFALLLAVGASLVLGFVSLRFREMHFAIATLAFAMLIVAILNNWEFVGASGGMAASYRIPHIPVFELLGISPGSYEAMFAVSLIAILLLLCGQALILQTRIGRAIVTIREDEMLAQSLGVAISRYKILAFVLSSIPAAAAGILYSPFLTFIYPNAFGFTLLVNTILLVAVGGAGSLSGPIIGAILFAALPELLGVSSELRLAIYGLALIGITLFTPRGIIGLMEDCFRQPDVIAPTKKAYGPRSVGGASV
jgi:branched-chain amino acid transport system permease protein